MEEANHDDNIDDIKFNELIVKIVALAILVIFVIGLLWLNYSMMVKQIQRDKDALISILTNAPNYNYIPPVAGLNVTFDHRLLM